jgi:hypothetical protein
VAGATLRQYGGGGLVGAAGLRDSAGIRCSHAREEVRRVSRDWLGLAIVETKPQYRRSSIKLLFTCSRLPVRYHAGRRRGLTAPAQGVPPSLARGRAFDGLSQNGQSAIALASSNPNIAAAMVSFATIRRRSFRSRSKRRRLFSAKNCSQSSTSPLVI